MRRTDLSMYGHMFLRPFEKVFMRTYASDIVKLERRTWKCLEVFDPAYQSTQEAPFHAGSQVTKITLSAANGWQIDPHEVRAALRPHTKYLVLNEPSPIFRCKPPPRHADVHDFARSGAKHTQGSMNLRSLERNARVAKTASVSSTQVQSGGHAHERRAAEGARADRRGARHLHPLGRSASREHLETLRSGTTARRCTGSSSTTRRTGCRRWRTSRRGASPA